MTEKIDLKKDLQHLYRPSAKAPVIVKVPAMNFLVTDGAGNPNTSPAYAQAIEALYGVSYTLKFTTKKELGRDYVVMPLEGLWWGVPMDKPTLTEVDKEKFQWTSMIMQPDFITQAMVARAIEELSRKKDLPNLSDLRLETYEEGLAVQILYIGPFADEGPTIQGLHRFAKTQGYQLHGLHHEIYLSDPRRTAPEKLKTVIRQPVRQ